MSGVAYVWGAYVAYILFPGQSVLMSAPQFPYILFVYVRNSLYLLHSMSGQSVLM